MKENQNLKEKLKKKELTKKEWEKKEREIESYRMQEKIERNEGKRKIKNYRKRICRK